MLKKEKLFLNSPMISLLNIRREFRKIISLSLIITFLFINSLLPLNCSAASFNPNYILSNQELTDYQSMSLGAIQRFLNSKSGILKNYQTKDIDGKKKTAAEIIFQASQRYKINPQVILTLLQKEQSLIDNPRPTSYNLDWACGYHRPTGSDPNDPKLQPYKGFAVQVDGAAATFRWYIDHYPTPWLRIAGKTYNFDGHLITPQNMATAALYNYTPHYQGNYQFWKIWQKWFVKIYPDGTLLQAEGEPGIWLIQHQKRRPFLSRAAFLSRYNPQKVILVSKEDLEKYEIGQPIKFPQYSLLRSPGGTVYLLVDDERRGFRSKEAFMMMGFNPEEIIDVSWQDLSIYPEGKPITIKSVYPVGALLQDRKTGAVFYVKDGIKRGIIDKSILEINFPHYHLIPAAEGELEKYLKGKPLGIKDGELVKASSESSVYVIANGLKRPIISAEVFEKLGYKWENIKEVPKKVLDLLHPTGPIIDITH